MKSTLLVLALAASFTATSCLTQAEGGERRPVIRGMEKIDNEVREHFEALVEEGFASVADSDSIDVTENDDEKVIVMEADGELRVYLLVFNGETYETALQFAVENDVDIPEGEQVELLTSIIESNADLLQTSERTARLRQSIESGASLGAIASEQVTIQEESNTAAIEDSGDAIIGRPVAASRMTVDCAGSGTAVCCGFSGGKGVRIMCICNTGSNQWILCYDSGWKN